MYLLKKCKLMQKAKKIENSLKFVFGELYYAELKEFFYQFYKTKDYDFIIFTTRRCHILFCIFRQYIFKSKKNNNVVFISDKALHFYNNELNNCNCAIVDDILIHGRALQAVKNRVLKKSPNSIETFVFMESKERQISADHSVEKDVSKKMWKQFSNKIVSAIVISSFPYTSYIYSVFRFLNNKKYRKLLSTLITFFPNFVKCNLSLNEVDNKNELNNLLEKNIECYIFDVSEYSKKFGLEFSCLRVYYNKYLECCVVIPYCITNSMNENQIDNVLNKYFNLKSNIQKVEKYETKYRAITTLYSYGLLCFIKKTYKLNLLRWFNNKENINMSYYNRFFSEISSALRKKEIILLQNNSSKDFLIDSYLAHKSNLDEPLLNDIYKNIFLKCSTNKKHNESFFDTSKKEETDTLWFYDYLATVNINEESCFNQCLDKTPEKQLGLSFEIIHSSYLDSNTITEKNESSKFNLYSKLISCADSGFLSIYADYYLYKTRNEFIKIYSNYLITGEHICRLFQNKYLVFISELYAICNDYIKQYNLKISNENIRNTIAAFLLEIKNTGVPQETVDNIISANSFVENFSNIQFVFDNIYEDVNEEILYDLFDNFYDYIEEAIKY